MEVTCKLNKERSYEVNELEDKKEKFLIKK